MAETTVQTIYNIDGTRRVLIVKRDNGYFSFNEEYFSDEPQERCWLPYSYSRGSYTNSQELAIREACSRVDWLANVLENQAILNTKDSWRPPPIKVRGRPILGVIALVCLLSGFLGAVAVVLMFGHGESGLGALILSVLSIGVGSGLAALAAIGAFIRGERWAVMPAIVLLISLGLGLWIADMFTRVPPESRMPLNEQLRGPGN